MIDLTKLTPAPWIAIDSRYEPETYSVNGVFDVPEGYVQWAVTGGRPDNPTEGWSLIHGEAGHGTIIPERSDLEFIALARNDLDVKQRRGWHTQKCTDAPQWLVSQLVERLCGIRDQKEFDSLIAAMYQDDHDVDLLTKADAWYRENVEKKGAEARP